jgi:hypothetical protein
MTRSGIITLVASAFCACCALQQPADAAELVHDDFNADRSKWEVVTRTWEVRDGQLRGIGAGGGVDAWIYAGRETWTDYAVETRASASEATGNAEVVLRSTGHWQNEYRISVLGPGPGNFQIEVRVATAANGDQVYYAITGMTNVLNDPCVAEGTLTVVGGTGRFAAASGEIHTTSMAPWFAPYTCGLEQMTTLLGTIAY